MKKTIFVAIISLGICGTGCKAEQKVETANNEAQIISAGSIKYKIQTITETVPDSDSPMGGWEIDKTYPVILSAKKQGLTKSLNEKIEQHGELRLGGKMTKSEQRFPLVFSR